MDTPKTRENFRHLYGQLRKEDQYSNLKVKSSGSTCLIRSSATLFGVPWESGGGALGVIPLSKRGKVVGATVLRAHTQPISSFDFHPFQEGIIATGSRENVIKIWNVMKDGSEIKSGDITDAVSELQGHEKRIVSVDFHPLANNILFSTSGDLTCKIWDLEKSKDMITLKGHVDVVESVSWHPLGTLVATSSKDNKIRIYDPRSGENPSQIFEVSGSSAKPSRVTWTSDSKIFTVGFNKEDRILNLWDVGNTANKISEQRIDTSPGFISPYFDPSTGVVFLGGKMPASKSDISMLPKRVCDVSQCEVARFLAVSDTAVDTFSFIIPRKATNLFQEDLYQNVPSGKSSQSSSEWLSGKMAEITYMNMRPKDMLSVYEVGEEEGGRSRLKDIQRGKAKANITLSDGKVASATTVLTEGKVKLEVPGWLYYYWANRWLQVKKETIYLFETQESANSLEVIPIDNVNNVTPALSEPAVFVISVPPKSYRIQVSSKEERDHWILSLTETKNRFVSSLIKRSPSSSEILSKIDGKQEETEQVVEETPMNYEGFLNLWTQGYLYNYWWKVHAKIQGDLFQVYASPTASTPVETIHLDKVVAVIETTSFPDKQNTFQVNTAEKVYNFYANDKQEKENWMETLDSLVKKYVELAGGVVTDEKSLSVQGYLDVKLWLLALTWSKYWIQAVGGHVSHFTNSSTPKPWKKIAFTEIKSIEKSTRDRDLAFQLVLKDNSVYHYRFGNSEDRNRWISVLNELKDASHVTSNLIDQWKLTDISEEDIASNPKAVLMMVFESNRSTDSIHRSDGCEEWKTKTIVKLSHDSLNSGSVYVLDAGMTIYQWNGKKANRISIAKGLDLANRIKMKERGGKANLIVLQEGEDRAPAFWDAFGKVPSSIAPAPQNDEPERMVVALYKVTDDGAFLRHKGRPCSKDLLATQYAFVVDTGTEIFIWIGRSATTPSRRLASRLANKLALDSPKLWVAITKVYESGETVLFKEKFTDFPGMLPISTTRQAIVSNVARPQVQEKIDVKAMHSHVFPQPQMADDGTQGKLEIFVIEDFEKYEYPKEKHGHLYSGDCFLIMYTYTQKNQEKILIYFWQGRDASINEKGASAYLTKELSSVNSKKEVSQVRVVQNSEPLHLLAIFKGSLIVHNGKFKKRDDTKNRLFDIRGTSAINTKAVEIELKNSALNSNHSFLVSSPAQNTIFVWNGKLSNQFERNSASKVAELLKSSPETQLVQLEESSESPEFWEILGGKTENYYKPKGARVEPRLFLCSTASGAAKAEEIFHLYSSSQDDLDASHLMILDAFHEVFVWFGDKSNVAEQKVALETAIEYVKKSPKHPPTTPVLVTKKHQEPLLFSGNFQGWYPTKPKQSVLQEIPAWSAKAEDIFKDYTKETYSIDELLSDPLPKGVDPTRLDDYLSDVDFEQLFKMSRENFKKVPTWKRENLKRDVGLF